MSRIKESLARQLEERIEMRDRLLASTAKQVVEYDADIRDLQKALAALAGDEEAEGAKYVPDNKVTIKDMILEVLALRPQGATAQELLVLIKDRFDLSLKRESLSPQLSRLRSDDRKIELRGRNWYLAEAEPVRADPDTLQQEFKLYEGAPDGLPH